MDGCGPQGENLIFIICPPRSGSTLLQKILGAHSEIHTTSEPWIALPPLFVFHRSGTQAPYGAKLYRRALREFLSGLPEGNAAYWESVRLMLSHLYGRALETSGKRLFVDKTPRYYYIIRELRKVFPRAKHVLLFRNPLAVMSSMLEAWIQTDPKVLRQFRDDLLLAPRNMVDAIREFGAEQSVVHYEELTSDPERVVAKLCRELDIAFEEGMVNYGESAAGRTRWLYGDPQTVYQNQRPTTGRTDRWKEVIASVPLWTNWAGEYLNELGRALVTELGYDFDELSASIGVTGIPGAGVFVK